MTTEQPVSSRRVLTGRVVSDKMDKTVVVEVTRRVKHPKYGKYMKRTSRYKAHDEANSHKVDDIVDIQEHRPISRDKRWLVLDSPT